MSTFTVTRQWMQHSGGTKFYVMFRIQRDNDRAGTQWRKTWEVCPAHYGPMSAAPGGSATRPIQGGQTAIYPKGKYETQLQAKRSRGYRNTESETNRTFGEKDFRRWLEESFRTADRDSILRSLEMSLDPDAQPIDPDDKPTTPVETVPYVEPEGWGSW